MGDFNLRQKKFWPGMRVNVVFDNNLNFFHSNKYGKFEIIEYDKETSQKLGVDVYKVEDVFFRNSSGHRVFKKYVARDIVVFDEIAQAWKLLIVDK